MNIRNAILKAADHIERNPRDFDFGSYGKPECGTPGCALGWVGAFLAVDDAGLDPRTYLRAVASACGVPKPPSGGFWSSPEGVFYGRMNDLNGEECWMNSADDCAVVLRRYADKYHPAHKLGIPASVRAIFETAQSPVPC